MSFDNLRLFRDIAQTRSLTRAAELSRVTPSAASQHLNELEKKLGTQLLDRSTRPLTLTGEGKLYQQFCVDVLRRNEEFQAALDQLRSEVEGTVRVAAIYSVGLSEMSRLECELSAHLPNVRLEVDYLRPEKVYESVLADGADLGLVSYPESTRDITVIPWRDEEMVVAMAPTHALASRQTVDPSDLGGEQFVTFDDDLPIAREISRYLRDAQVSVNMSMHFDNIQTIKEAVMLGSGVSIVPMRILRSEMAEGRIAAVKLTEPGLSRPVGIIHRRRKRFHRAAQAFLDLLQNDTES
ncbi:MAG: LysR family transcriptional regulator [Bryobacteraceae bacterium]|nr:LysR family transcriptional regulator [Bryobacteraceae bacterium]